MSASATMGISGDSLRNSVTFASNSPAIQSDLCIRYTPQCSVSATPPEAPVRIRAVKLSPAARNAPLRAGSRFKVSTMGSGSGRATLRAAINGQRCSSSTMLDVESGRAIASGRIPASLDAAASTRISIRVGDARASRLIYGRARQHTRMSTRSVEKACKSLFSTLR